MGSLSAHLREPGDHGRLAFHPRVPGLPPRTARRRAARPTPSSVAAPRPLLAAGVLALSSATPTAALAAEPDQRAGGHGGARATVPPVDPASDPTSTPAATRPTCRSTSGPPQDAQALARSRGDDSGAARAGAGDERRTRPWPTPAIAAQQHRQQPADRQRPRRRRRRPHRHGRQPSASTGAPADAEPAPAPRGAHRDADAVAPTGRRSPRGRTRDSTPRRAPHPSTARPPAQSATTGAGPRAPRRTAAERSERDDRATYGAEPARRPRHAATASASGATRRPLPRRPAGRVAVVDRQRPARRRTHPPPGSPARSTGCGSSTATASPPATPTC